MARNRRIRPKQRTSLGDPELRHYLVTGEESFDFVLFGGASTPVSASRGFEVFAALEEAWTAARVELVAAAVETRPGTRPWAWWLFDAPRDPAAPEERAAASPGPTWRAPRERARVGGTGRPEALRGQMFGLAAEWSGVDPADPPVVESQAAYLVRHRLVARDERARIPAGALRPEVIQADRFRLDSIGLHEVLWPAWSSDVFRGGFSEIQASEGDGQ